MASDPASVDDIILSTVGNDSKIWSPSGYDDEGLVFTLLVGLFLTVVFVLCSANLFSTTVLWIKRLYRPNHTIKPHEIVPSPASDPELSLGTPLCQKLTSSPTLESSRSLHSPTIEVDVVVNREKTVTRRKRLGVALPFTSVFFQVPTWTDWVGVEEKSVPYLSTVEAKAAEIARRSTTTSSPRRYGTSPDDEEEESGREGSDSSASHSSRSLSPPAQGTADGIDGVDPSCLPKTPLDPQVSMYLFTLKYVISVLCVGCVFIIWICPLSASDNYIANYMVQRDTPLCRRHRYSRSGCENLQPHCVWEAFKSGGGTCKAVAVHGVYEWTVQNIRPGSPLWWGVGILNLGFCLAFTAITVFYVRRSDRFIQQTTDVQMKVALGYRVACVRGLTGGYNQESFNRKYLIESAYFPPLRNSASSRNDDVEYVNVNCFSVSSLYSVIRCDMNRTRRQDATFTKPGRVRQVSFTRYPPPGMYAAISKTERVKAALQQAVAHENALRRPAQLILRSDGVSPFMGALTAPPQPMLMRAPFPSCCQKVPAVPFYTEKFRKRVKNLNKVISLVDHQRSAGSAFIVFSDARSAFEFVNLFNTCFARSLHSTVAVIAGPASGVIPSNLPVGRLSFYLRVSLCMIVFVVMVIFWSVPVGFLSSLNNIELVPGIGPALYSAYVEHLPPSLQTLMTAYLPVAVLALFNIVVPFIIRYMVEAMGVFSIAERNGGQLFLLYVFMILTAVVFQTAVQGSLSRLQTLVANSDLNRADVENFLVLCVTPTGGYWYAKVITATVLSTWIELLDPARFFWAFFARGRSYVQWRYDAMFQPCTFNYPKVYSFDLMILSIGILFHMTVPLLSFFVMFYFITRFCTMRQRLYERYRPKILPVRDCTDFSISAQVIRCIVVLYFVAEFCGVWLMFVRQHSGGSFLTMVTCLVSSVLMCWVFVKTARWVPTVSTARSLFPEDASTAPQPLLQRETTVDPIHEGEEDGGLEEDLTVMHQSKREEENPFTGHLLPRQLSAVSRYHPKHQRLVPIDVDDELNKMQHTDFLVERYWDSGISWFETDHQEHDFLDATEFIVADQ